MKSIKPVTVGSQIVTFKIKRVPFEAGKPYAVDLIATCEAEVREHRITFHPNPNRALADFQNDIDKQAQKLAEETVGHLKAKSALDSIFAEDTPPKK